MYFTKSITSVHDHDKVKLGLGLYKSLLNENNFRFARQAGATHLVVQLVDYLKGGDNPTLTRDYLGGWGITDNADKLWQYDDLVRLKKAVTSHGLTLEAIENLDPSHWFDILLDGPLKERQLENIKQTIKAVGKAGIPILGYYFSIAGVWGWNAAPTGRGKARSVGFDASLVNMHQPIPKGMVWNMTYDTNAEEGTLGQVSHDEIWQRFEYYLRAVIPVAEEHGVRLAAHPDDPPVPELRGTARLFHSLEEYEKLLQVVDSQANGFECCLGTIQEMEDGDLYAFVDKHTRSGKICYIHFRNVKGKVPSYREVFVDEGDIDMIRVLGILAKNEYDGVLIPDHTPEMSTKAAWHTGMAYALGYMRAGIQAVEKIAYEI